ncbi:MAG: hypothetical protein RJA49_1084, partial [Actinomycetota bacterium]
GVLAQQDDSRGANSPNGPANSTAPTSPVSVIRDPNASTTLPGGGRPSGGAGGSTTSVPRLSSGGSSGSSAMPLFLLTLVIGLVLWVLLAPRAIAAMQRGRSRTPRDRVILAWRRACNSLSMAGAPPIAGSTPLEYALTVEESVGVSHHTIRELAVQVTRAVYSPATFGEALAVRCETLEAEVNARCRSITPWSLRLRGLVDPRLMRQRIVG